MQQSNYSSKLEEKLSRIFTIGVSLEPIENLVPNLSILYRNLELIVLETFYLPCPPLFGFYAPAEREKEKVYSCSLQFGLSLHNQDTTTLFLI